ncbi:hypothetical protein NMY22_g10108 [Coprinellus aureogranulatus]|nr:hypothetical protein NMY22_g10108 [Coprinellus aureogranulatus]
MHQASFGSGSADHIPVLIPILDASHTRNRRTAPLDSVCLPGTRKDVIRDILAWAENSDVPSSQRESDSPSDRSGVPTPSPKKSILWLCGPVGCGKSAIAQTVAEELERRHRLAGSFFFFRGSDDRSKFSRFIVTLATQIALAIPEAEPVIKRAMKLVGVHGVSVVTQLKRLIFDPFLNLRASGTSSNHPSPETPIFLIVIDGFDECDDREDVADLITHAVEFFDRHPDVPLRFLFSSRIEEHIRERIESEQVRTLDLSDYSAEEDIRYMARHTFSLAMKRSRVIRSYGAAWPGEDGIASLVGKAGGSFIFIRTPLDFILGNNRSAIDDGRTPMDRWNEALEMNGSLDSLYHEVLLRARHIPHFSDVIGTITLHSGELAVSDIAFLLGIPAIQGRSSHPPTAVNHSGSWRRRFDARRFQLITPAQRSEYSEFTAFRFLDITLAMGASTVAIPHPRVIALARGHWKHGWEQIPPALDLESAVRRRINHIFVVRDVVSPADFLALVASWCWELLRHEDGLNLISLDSPVKRILHSFPYPYYLPCLTEEGTILRHAVSVLANQKSAPSLAELNRHSDVYPAAEPVPAVHKDVVLRSIISLTSSDNDGDLNEFLFTARRGTPGQRTAYASMTQDELNNGADFAMQAIVRRLPGIETRASSVTCNDSPNGFMQKPNGLAVLDMFDPRISAIGTVAHDCVVNPFIEPAPMPLRRPSRNRHSVTDQTLSIYHSDRNGRSVPLPVPFHHHAPVEDGHDFMFVLTILGLSSVLTPSLAPIERIPDDVLRHIFAHGLPSDGSPATVHPSQAPILFTQVSRRWRRVSTDCGALWTSLKFSHSDRKVAWSTERVRAFSMYAGRSKEAPLSLLLSVTHRTRFITDAPNLVQNLVKPFAPRLTSLALKCISIDHLHDLPQGLFSQLTRLAMAFNPRQLSKFDWASRGPIQAFGEAPSLRKLALKQRKETFEYAGDFDWTQHILLPWRQLTHVLDDDNYYQASNIPTMRRYLELCPDLRYMFASLPEVESDQGSGPPVRAGGLETLAFQSLTGQEWPTLLKYIEFPDLQRIYVTGNALDFESYRAADNTLHTLLGATPHVDTIGLSLPGETLASLLAKLAFPNLITAEGILLNLRTIIIEDPVDLPPDAFNAFLSTRCHCPREHRLRKLVIYFRHEKLLERGKPMLDVVRSFPGLDVEVHVVTLREQQRYLWMDHDPELEDWKEAVEILAGVPRPVDNFVGVRVLDEDEWSLN